MTWLADVLKALERGATAFLAFVATALLSAGYELGWLKLRALPDWTAGAANAAAIAFGVLALPWVFHMLGAPFRWVSAKGKLTRNLWLQINTLTVEEAAIFWAMVAEQRSNTHARLGHGTMGDEVHEALYRRGLLKPIAPVGEGWALVVPDRVWNLVAHRQDEAREILAKLPRTERRGRI